MNADQPSETTAAQAPQPPVSGEGAGFSAVTGSGPSLGEILGWNTPDKMREYFEADGSPARMNQDHDHCHACGKGWVDHLGISGTCEKLQIAETAAYENALKVQALRDEVDGLRKTLAQWGANAAAVAHELDVPNWKSVTDFIPAIHRLQDRARSAQNVCVSDGPADAPESTRSAEGPFAARNG